MEERGGRDEVEERGGKGVLTEQWSIFGKGAEILVNRGGGQIWAQYWHDVNDERDALYPIGQGLAACLHTMYSLYILCM